ncbi:suppressor of fused domain protein [Marininema halotolerans]|uniref:Suppressor of fused protein (SUFU) n=1 Tax=Marininema halotolerans TaxID=1155944 RepID=A0A1I6ULE8_9BACL|nr:suppressor of fused domain protein [Marininema halotolerans]SFT02306.1 Suppressor of fused protein (SUFU) [Marininema halotolerans]
MDNYISFLEKQLGEIECGWRVGEGSNYPFNIVKYKRGPFPGTVTYSTLGISHHNLKYSDSQKEIRQELLIVADLNFGDQNIPGILEQVGMKALETHSPYLRGEVIGPRGPLFQDSSLEALYVSIPVYFPDSFHVFHKDKDVPIVQAWLIPITSAEAKFVHKNGWNKFEDKLEKVDPDLIDFNRTSIID